MVIDIVPWLIGPAGIVLGWWLNQRTLRGNAERQAQQAEEAAERHRVLKTVGLARDTQGLIRSLLHSVYLKQEWGKPPQGFIETVDEFNETKDDFRGSILALRVLGPSWAVEGAERLDIEITKFAELAFLMQQGVKEEHMTSVNAGLPELEHMLREYVETISDHYNAAPSQLPPQPDMEAEGRWKPIEE